MILLDTHVLVWLAEGSPRLGKGACKVIDTAFQSDGVMVSAISFWEVAMLLKKNRLTMDLDIVAWHKDLIRQGLCELPVTSEIGIKAAGFEPFHGDPADRLIVATALLHSLTLVTADKQLLKSGFRVKTVDAAI